MTLPESSTQTVHWLEDLYGPKSIQTFSLTLETFSLTLKEFSLTLKTFSLTLKKRFCAKQRGSFSGRQTDKGTDIKVEKGWISHLRNGQNKQNRQTVGWKQEGALTWRCQPLLSLPRPVRTTIAVREDGILRFTTAETDFANDVGYSLFLHLPGDAVWCKLCFVLPCIQYHLPTQPVPRNHAQQLEVFKFAFFCSCVPFGVQVVKNVR